MSCVLADGSTSVSISITKRCCGGCRIGQGVRRDSIQSRRRHRLAVDGEADEIEAVAVEFKLCGR